MTLSGSDSQAGGTELTLAGRGEQRLSDWSELDGNQSTSLTEAT